MTGRWMVILGIAVMLGIIGASLWLNASVWAQESETSGGEQTSGLHQTVPDNPVVAVIPYRSETEYEPDPFEPDRIRRTQTEVKELILVRADGSIEHKRAW